MTAARYLLDTNVCIYLLEGLSEPARARVEQQAPGAIVTSAICYAEVMRGVPAGDAEAVAKTERLFALIPALDFGSEAALHYARLPFRRHSFDRLIAAHAMAAGLTLVTNNVADFADVPGLAVENWTGPA